jgi:asparagine synthase (glutamine-hydrolysing)
LPNNLLNKFPPYNDESEFFNSAVNFNDIANYHKKVFCNNLGIFNLIKNELKIQSVPINNTLPYLSNELLNYAKNDNIKTVFSGFGGDEGISNQGSFLIYSWARNFNIYKLVKYKKNFVKHIVKAYYSKNTTADYNYNYYFLNDEFVKDNKLEKLYFNHIKKAEYKTLSEFIGYKLSANYIPNRMELFQQSASYRGISYSFPLLDYKLLEYYFSIPDNYKFYKAKKRYIFKQAITGFVPQNILERNSKYGATIPNVLHRFMIDYDIIYEYLQASKNGKAANYIDIEKMITRMELIKQLYNGKRIRANQHIFFNALMIIMYLNDN